MRYLDLKTPAQAQAQDLKSDYGLENHGLINLHRVYWNLPTPSLVEEAVFRGEGYVVHGGPFIANTGKHTARSAADKFIVREGTTDDRIWWGEYNKPYPADRFQSVDARLQAFLQNEEVFVHDCFAGSDPRYRMPIRVITEKAWHCMFARNMFVRPRRHDDYNRHVPEFTVISVPSFKLDPRQDGTRTETGILVNFAQRKAIIAHSAYAGEIKKTIFSVLNFLLPLEGVLPMHCSANVGQEGDAALFFGLSGTGKTTLSADPDRFLIGDDEHGWSDEGIFNFEGGCYAKVIRLSKENEPEIYTATRRFGAILENVVFDPTSRRVDLDDDSITENTRASYPLGFIPHVVEERMVNEHPKNIIFLTCDASGVLPPIARLNPEQSQYHFISGYTSKIAGTEIGLGTEPQITFSACFGAPFMVHHPFEYARLLSMKKERYGAKCWLVNTGWTGGPFGVGRRISIKYTRAILAAAFSGALDKVEYRKDKLFGFEVPTSCPEVPPEVLDPVSSWGSKDEYWNRYDTLAARYIENFKLFAEGCPPEVAAAGPIRLAAL